MEIGFMDRTLSLPSANRALSLPSVNRALEAVDLDPDSYAVVKVGGEELVITRVGTGAYTLQSRDNPVQVISKEGMLRIFRNMGPVTLVDVRKTSPKGISKSRLEAIPGGYTASSASSKATPTSKTYVYSRETRVSFP